MPAALAMLLATTVTLTVPSTGGSDCPSPAQLTDALNARVPGLVAPSVASPPAPAGAPGLSLSTATLPEGDLRVDLFDAQGESLLHRVLPAPPRGRDADCPAFAETVALIVERYLHDVGYEAPPLAPPPPKPEPAAPPAPAPATLAVAPPPPPDPRVRWRLGLAAIGRLGDAGGWDGDGELVIGLEGAGDGPRVGARLSVGLAPATEARWSDQMSPEGATLRRVPLRLGLYWRIPTRAGQLEPGVGTGFDALFVSSSDPATPSEHHFAPFGDLSLGYTLPPMGPVYVRALSRVALAVPYDFETLGHSHVWGTPRVYGELGVESGFAFP